MTGAVVIRWGASIPGREAKGLEVFGKAIEQFEGFAKEGKVHGHREYIALTGKSGGFMIADGDVAELQKILISPEVLSLNSQAESIVSDFEIQLYGGGTDQSVQELIGTYTGGLSELGYM
jgi:hypothetical protein